MATTSNCRAWALAEYAYLHRTWVKAGRPVGAEPYLLRRPTRMRVTPTRWCPAWVCNWLTDRIPHYMVGVLDASGRVSVRSFVPDTKGPDVLHPTQILQALRFPGRVVSHDHPTT